MVESKGYIRTSDDKGSINICQSVVATIAAAATADIDGVYGLYQYPGRELTSTSGKKRISKGVKIVIDGEDITVDVYLIAEMSRGVNEIAAEVQKAVMTAIEETIGIEIMQVNVHVCGVSLKKAKQAV